MDQELAFKASAKANPPRDILVIDDQPDALEMTVASLNRLGWKALQAANSSEALSKIKTNHATVGLALVDVILPDMDGMSLARQMRTLYPRLAIVMLSGKLNAESRWIVSDEGFRFLPKPFSLSQLRDVVIEVLGNPESTHSV